MNEGRLLQCDTPEQIKADFPHRVFEVVCQDVHKAVSVLHPLLKKNELQLFGDRLHLLVTKKNQVTAAVKILVNIILRWSIYVKSHRLWKMYLSLEFNRENVEDCMRHGIRSMVWLILGSHRSRSALRRGSDDIAGLHNSRP